MGKDPVGKLQGPEVDIPLTGNHRVPGVVVGNLKKSDSKYVRY